jgi:hypothetical protein
MGSNFRGCRCGEMDMAHPLDLPAQPIRLALANHFIDLFSFLFGKHRQDNSEIAIFCIQ